MNCAYKASGDLVCDARPGPRRAPAVEPWAECSEHGCSEGRPCASSSECANGLTCRAGVCTKFNPFTRDNLRDERREGPVDGAGAAARERRRQQEREYRQQVRQTGVRPQEMESAPTWWRRDSERDGERDSERDGERDGGKSSWGCSIM